MNTAFDGYAPYKGDIQYRKQGSLIAYEAGETITYGLFNAQERGTLFVDLVRKYTVEWSSDRLVKQKISRSMYAAARSLQIHVLQDQMMH